MQPCACQNRLSQSWLNLLSMSASFLYTVSYSTVLAKTAGVCCCTQRQVQCRTFTTQPDWKYLKLECLKWSQYSKLQPRFWDFDAIYFAIFKHTEVFQGLKTFHCLKVSSSSPPHMVRTKSTSLKFASSLKWIYNYHHTCQSISNITLLWRSNNRFACRWSAYTG